MKSLPEKSGLPVVRDERAQVERIRPEFPFSPFFSFTYSHFELRASSNGQTHVQSKTVQCENGRIESETFNGTVPIDVFDKMRQDFLRFLQIK